MADTAFPDFQVYSSALEPITKVAHPLFPTLPESTDDMPVLTAVASSTEIDLYEDTMAITALQDMCEVPIGQSCFLNHVYELPSSYFGKSLARPVLVNSDGVTDLHTAYGVYLNEEGARRTYNQIKDFGAKHGVSGGFMILEWSFDGDGPEDWFAPIIINRVLKLEDSIVSIPANQRSWVENAIGGLFQRCVRDDNGEDAIRLAPAYKGLFPIPYKELVKSLRSDGLRKELERRPIRSSNAKTRLSWEPLKKHFVFQQGQRSQVVERDAIPGLLKTYSLRPAISQEIDTKSATGKTSWPLMSLDTEWTGSKAEKEIFDYARNDDGDIVASKAKPCFLYTDTENGDKQSGYKMPYCYVDGSPKIVPKGVQSCANVLQGGMGGVDASDEDKAAMKSKVKTMYGRINSELKPDPEWVVPWEKEEKSMDDIEEKGVTINDDGTHAAMTGTHSHSHTDGNSGDHEHSHEHTDDANHGHVHDNPTDDDGDGDYDDDTKSIAELTPIQQYQVAQINALGMAILGEQWTTLSFTDLLTVKDGREISAKNAAKLKEAHDAIASIGGSDVCSMASSNDADTQDDTDDSDDETTKSIKALLKDAASLIALQTDAINEQRGIIDQQHKAIGELVLAVKDAKVIEASVLKSAEQVAATSKELEAIALKHKKAVKDVNAIAASIDSLKAMPLGDPRNFQRSVTLSGEGVVSAKDFLAINDTTETLEEALQHTEIRVKTLANGNTMRVRYWPSGVGKGVVGEVEGGVRPALGPIQRKNMNVTDWYLYESGESEVSVPIVPGEDAADILAKMLV